MHPESKVIELWPKLGTTGGLQLLGEWYGCCARPVLLESAAALRRLCLHATQESGLTIVGHVFRECAPGQVSGVILMSGAHLAIHTSAARRSATIDIFVSSRAWNNRAPARAVYARLRDGLLPDKENILQVDGSGVADVSLQPA
jgi:S-adenosylmethionine/arginine decarboxylase-like enzyme